MMPWTIVCTGCGTLRGGVWGTPTPLLDVMSAQQRLRPARSDRSSSWLDGAGSRHSVRYRRSRRLTMGDEAAQHFERVLLEQRRLGL